MSKQCIHSTICMFYIRLDIPHIVCYCPCNIHAYTRCMSEHWYKVDNDQHMGHIPSMSMSVFSSSQPCTPCTARSHCTTGIPTRTTGSPHFDPSSSQRCIVSICECHCHWSHCSCSNYYHIMRRCGWLSGTPPDYSRNSIACCSTLDSCMGMEHTTLHSYYPTLPMMMIGRNPGYNTGNYPHCEDMMHSSMGKAGISHLLNHIVTDNWNID